MLLRLELLWFVAFGLLGSGGPGIFFAILFLTERYPQLQPFISALSSASSDASAIGFYLFNALYFTVDLGLGAIATGWLALCMLLLSGCSLRLEHRLQGRVWAGSRVLL